LCKAYCMWKYHTDVNTNW